MAPVSKTSRFTAGACVAAAAGAGSYAFLAAGGKPLTPTSAAHTKDVQFLGRSAKPIAEGSGCSGVMGAGLASCLVAGAAANVAGRKRAVKASRGVFQELGKNNRPEEAKAVFADGLVGSEYHGWGKYEWDPAGFTERWPEHLPWYREAELKHGRVCMLAFLGFIVPDSIRIPIEVLEDPNLNMLNAHNKLIGPGLGEGPMWYLLAFCGIVESLRFRQLGLGFEKLTLENAGDLNFGKGFLPKTEEGQVQMRIKELKNGRLAMMAVGGILTQAQIWQAPHFPFVPAG